MHTPVEVTDEAMAIVKRDGIDGTVAIGGGSTTGLGKAIALRTDLPQIVIPTTYAGSEMTNLLGETAGGEKKTLRDPKIRPETVIYDVDLTLGLPLALSVNSGLNAMAHAVEGLYARDGNPVLSLMAEEGIRALGAALPGIHRNPRDAAARRRRALRRLALRHRARLLVGRHPPQALPRARRHFRPAARGDARRHPAARHRLQRIGRAGGDRPGGAGARRQAAAPGLFDMAKAAGAPTALRDIGMPESGLDRAADLAVADPYWNPRPIDRASIRALLDDAWHGRRPT